MIYSINYDLKRPGQNYDALHEAIKGCGSWWHYLGSTWLVDTNLNAKGIWDRLSPYVDKNDNMFIVSITRDYNGWLPKAAWDWINQRAHKAVA